MNSKSLRTVSILALLIPSLSPLSAHAQDKQRHVYLVKYICGTNEFDQNQTAATAAAGGYKTDINIQRAQNAGEARISVGPPSVGRSIFSESPGLTGRTHPTTLVGGEAVKVVCQDINGLIDRTIDSQFRVGFLQISSFEPLGVVAVYTAKHCRATVGSDFLRNIVCDGEIALDVVRYEPVLVEAVKDGSKSPTEPF
jgi:hypothetical protein